VAPLRSLRGAARSSSGRFLVRDHAVSYEPSATLLLSDLARPQRRFLAPQSAGYQQSGIRAAVISLPSSRGRGRGRRIARCMPIRVLSSAAMRPMRRWSEWLWRRHSPFRGPRHRGTRCRNCPNSFWHRTVTVTAPCCARDRELEACANGIVVSQAATRRTASCRRPGSLVARQSILYRRRSGGVVSLWAIEDDDADFFIAFHHRLVQRSALSRAAWTKSSG
jgi:hypothetical protein